MPMLTLGNPRAADVAGNLSAVFCIQQFRKRTSGILVHLQFILKRFRWKIGQVQEIMHVALRLASFIFTHAFIFNLE